MRHATTRAHDFAVHPRLSQGNLRQHSHHSNRVEPLQVIGVEPRTRLLGLRNRKGVARAWVVVREGNQTRQCRQGKQCVNFRLHLGVEGFNGQASDVLLFSIQVVNQLGNLRPVLGGAHLVGRHAFAIDRADWASTVAGQCIHIGHAVPAQRQCKFTGSALLHQVGVHLLGPADAHAD